MTESDKKEDAYYSPEIRLSLGEAYMMCNQCGAKLYSFDGDTDASRNCPYMRYGKCDI